MGLSKPDRRTQRTRQALMGAFIDLLLERGYDKISVADVVERANVGRSTFYAHYGGIDGMVSASLTHPSSQLAAVVEPEATAADFAGLLGHFKDQRRRNRAFFTAPLRTVWVRRLAELIEPRLAATTGSRPAVTPRLPLNLIAAQLAEAQIALVDNWLSLSPSTSAEIVAEALVATTQANLAALLGHEATGRERG